MKLKELELTGFKSFASKTTLSFPQGITAIVGPNGSGKSNVIDAIRWLLGERKAENIRGAKAEDLIFAGTPNRPRTGQARATIVFDNSDKTFPSEYDEIAISRRVARDGNSQYYLNESEVRLKDIVSFFAESKLGTRGLTIINQGNNDIFVRATPKERRSMIEEILGLKQYQIKKHEAQRKLITTRFNGEKVQAMIDELAPRLRLLRRQAARFERQSEIESELKDLEKQYFGFRIGQLESARASYEPEMQDIAKQIEEFEKELEVRKHHLKETESKGPKEDTGPREDHTKRRNEILEKRSKLQQDLGRLEAKMELAASQTDVGVNVSEIMLLLEEVWERLDQFLENDDWTNANSELQPLVDKIEGLLRKGDGRSEETSPDLLKEQNEIVAELQRLNNELKALEKEDSDERGELAQFNTLFRKAFEAVDETRRKIHVLEEKRTALQLKNERTVVRWQELEHQANQFGYDLKGFEAVTGVVLDVDATERRIFKLRGELAGIGELEPSLIQEAKETEERHTFLTSQLEDLHKAVKDLETLIHDLDKKLHTEFTGALKSINDQFNHFFRLMFGGGHGRLKLVKPEPIKQTDEEGDEGIDEDEDQDKKHAVDHGGIEVELSIPRKRIRGLEMLSGGEKSLVSIAALFALISVSPPPFLVLDEVDAALDEGNAKRFADIVRDFSHKTQFLIVTHNRATMEAADILYGVTMGDDGTSKVVSLKLEIAQKMKSAAA